MKYFSSEALIRIIRKTIVRKIISCLYFFGFNLYSLNKRGEMAMKISNESILRKSWTGAV
jgi:hypothetical protein